MADPKKTEAVPTKNVFYYVTDIPGDYDYNPSSSKDPYRQIRSRITGLAKLDEQGNIEYKVIELSPSDAERVKRIEEKIIDIRETELPPTAKQYSLDTRIKQVDALTKEKEDLLAKNEKRKGSVIAPPGYGLGDVIPASKSQSGLLTSKQVAELVNQGTTQAIARREDQRKREQTQKLAARQDAFDKLFERYERYKDSLSLRDILDAARKNSKYKDALEGVTLSDLKKAWPEWRKQQREDDKATADRKLRR